MEARKEVHPGIAWGARGAVLAVVVGAVLLVSSAVAWASDAYTFPAVVSGASSTVGAFCNFNGPADGTLGDTTGWFYAACQFSPIPLGAAASQRQQNGNVWVKIDTGGAYCWGRRQVSNGTDLGCTALAATAGGSGNNSQCKQLVPTDSIYGRARFNLDPSYFSGSAYSASYSYRAPTTADVMSVAYYSNATCTSTLVTNGGDQIAVGTVGTAHTYPSYPSDYFVGGQAGNSVPSPCFTYTPTNLGSLPVVVNFSAACSTDVAGLAKSWTFTGNAGSGSDTSGSSVTRTFSTSGAASVKLSVTQDGTTYEYTATLYPGATE